MQFNPPLTTATLIRRYKRFLADVCLADGSTLTVHCPNTGSMKTCSEPGSSVAISHSDNPSRKYPHTMEMIKAGSSWVGVNTSRTNMLVEEAILAGRIAEFSQVKSIRREVKVSASSRLDLAVTQQNSTCYVEVKNCSMAVENCAMFPDAVTARGNKHLQELSALLAKGHKSCMFFLVQREDADTFRPAAHIDPTYCQTLQQVVREGVIMLVYQAKVSPSGIEVIRPLPFTFE